MSQFNADDYRKQRDARRASATTSYQVKLPSGAMFTLRKPGMTAFFAGGRLPQSYIEKLMSFESKSADEIQMTIETFSAEEKTADLLFLGLIVRAACVVPRIVDNPVENTEIEFADIDDDDLQFIYRWAINAEGGADGEKAKSFRRTR